MIKADFHTHSVFSDGTDEPEEIVTAAIGKGFTAIGISDHAYEPFDSWCMKKRDENRYREEIERLKRLYGDRIKVLCGIEADYYSEFDAYGYDYIIGSVHYIEAKGKIYSVDMSREETEKNIAEGFCGDRYAYAERYFETVGKLREKTGARIIGHFDLLTKFEKQGLTFDEENVRYKTAYVKAIERTVKECIFEINTGGITRGYKERPYPSERIIKELGKYGGKFILSSDAHEKDSIGGFFDEAEKFANKYGVKIINEI